MGQVDQSVVQKLRADREVRRIDDLTRDIAARIKTATRRLDEAGGVRELLGKDDIVALLKNRQEILHWLVRRQTLIECWELGTGKVWGSSAFKDE